MLGRDGDAKGVKAYAATLNKRQDIDHILKDIAQSAEFKKKVFSGNAPDLAQAYYKGILGRDGDPEGMATYTPILSDKANWVRIMQQFIGSPEFREIYAGRTVIVDPSLHYDEPCWAFLHIEKTAGTSIQRLLATAFPKGSVLAEHTDSLYRRSAGELSQYSVFAGHFTYDSVRYIPRKSVSLLTFVREPKDRLSSLYHFLRAHEPSHPLFTPHMALANEVNMEAFFSHKQINRSGDAWNHMTRAVIGARQWQLWRQYLTDSSDPTRNAELIKTVIHPEIRKRMREFAFIGLQENFDRSVEMLCKVLNIEKPDLKARYQSVEHLAKVDPHFKQKVEKQPVTPECDRIMSQLIQLDTLVYEEAKLIFDEQIAREENREDTRIASDLSGAGGSPDTVIPNGADSEAQYFQKAFSGLVQDTRLTPALVRAGFGFILGRVVSEKDLQAHLELPAVRDLRRTLLLSQEFRDKYRHMQPVPQPRPDELSGATQERPASTNG